MICPGRLFIALLWLASLILFADSALAEVRYDVVVYGATPAGVTAAVAAARDGANVALLEPGKHVGGVVSGGLGHTDIGRRQAIGGLSREFFERIGKHYGKKLEWYFEPHVAEKVFVDWLAEAKVTVFYEHQLSEDKHAVKKDGARIQSILLTNGAQFAARQFIDASYEGDLMARAGVTYIVGRESSDEYGESLAGIQPVVRGTWEETLRTQPQHGPGYSSLMIPTIEWYKKRPNYLNTHQFPVPVSGLDEDGEPLPGVTSREAGKAGAGDGKFQAYNFRMCLTQNPKNRVPFVKPEGYDPREFELLRRYIAAWPDVKLGQIFHIAKMPGGKTDFNTSGPYSTDYLGAAWDYPEATYARRAEIWRDHQRFLQGLFYFLANDERLPEKLQTEAATWGLSKDEFVDTNHWPRQLYVRVARRMKGESVLTQHDTTTNVQKPDSVGMGSFIMDSHNVQRVLTTDGFVMNEGGFEVPGPPYEIPYGVLLPRKGECDNLLVPVCCSASYVAYCTLRMEPVYMALGHAAGVAATMAGDGVVQEIKRDDLQKKLRSQGQVLRLESYGDAPAGQAMRHIAVDNTTALFMGDWGLKDGDKSAIGGSFHHDMNAGKGEKTAQLELRVPKAGRYEVRLSHKVAADRATNVPVNIAHADGVAKLQWNQRQLPMVVSGYTVFGTYRFLANQPAVVTISNAGTDGYVVVDSLQLLEMP